MRQTKEILYESKTKKDDLMKKTKLLYNNYKFYIITAFVFLVAEWIYISNSFVNAPIGDYMEYICHFAAEDLKYGISFSTLFGVRLSQVRTGYLKK